WGINTALTIRKEAFPSFAAESVTVQVPFNGGVPEDVERGVAIKIEEALQGVDGIDHIRSTSSDAGATVIVDAIENYPLNKLFDEVKVQVDAISTFPAEAEKPVITENETENNVIWLDVHGDVPEKVLRETARSVRDELLKRPDINKVKTIGSRDYEMSIELSEDRLRAYDLTFNEVAEAVRQNSIDLSGGLLRSGRGDISLRARSQAYTATEFRRLPLRTTADGVRIVLGDVAEVRDGFVDQQFLNRFDGEPTVSLHVITNGDQDIVNASRQAATLAATYAKQTQLPEDVSITAWSDGSEPIRSRLALLLKNGLQGSLLVLVSLSLFLNLRLAVWVALGIPVSIAGALILFQIPGNELSLNMVTAFSFIIVLGIIVDDAIVLGESVFTEKESEKAENDQATRLRSTVRGVSRVVTPATFGVLTTIAAFFPLTQVSGRMGSVFGQIAFGVIFCLIFSLIESKLILPSHLAHINVHKTSNLLPARLWRRFQGLFTRGLKGLVRRIYRPFLGHAMRYRYVVIAMFIGILVLVGALLPSGKLRFVFFPNIYQDDIAVILELEEGLPVEHLHDHAQHIAMALYDVNEEIMTGGEDSVVRHVQISAKNNTKA
ncbi:MAG: efflux RND transporter permease subunit, partial [Verrucomicrobiota bacterium]